MNAQEIKLSFEDANPRQYGDAIYKAEYQGFTVSIIRDSTAGNPWEEWDGQPPIAIAGGRDRIHNYGDSDIFNPLKFISDGLLIRRQRDIAAALDVDFETFDRDARDNQDYRPSRGRTNDRLVDHKRDLLEDALSDAASGNKGDYFEALAALFGIAGIEALSTCSTGYSQGDYVDLLLVALPAWEKVTGAPRDSHARQLAAAAKLYGLYAWGDVYGFTIEDSEGEHIDSCWGFYTDDPAGKGFTESGMGEHVLPALAHAIAEKNKATAVELEESRPDMYAHA